MQALDKTYTSVAEAFWCPNPIEGYIAEGHMFNPRRETVSYIVKNADVVLLENREGEFQWCMAPAYLVGLEYKEALELYPQLKALAIPLVFEFDADSVFSCGAYFGWGAQGFGFGQMSFSKQENGDIEFCTEGLKKETTRLMLHQFVDYLIDHGVCNAWD